MFGQDSSQQLMNRFDNEYTAEVKMPPKGIVEFKKDRTDQMQCLTIQDQRTCLVDVTRCDCEC
jgi:hypothetical protein